MGTKPQDMWTEIRVGRDATGRKYSVHLWLERDKVTDEVLLFAEGTILKAGGRWDKLEGRTLVDQVAFGTDIDFREVIVPARGWQQATIHQLANIMRTYNSLVRGSTPPPLPPEVLMFVWERFEIVAPD